MPSLFNPNELTHLSRIQSFCNSVQALTRQLCLIWSVGSLYTQIIDMEQNKVKPPTPLLLKSHLHRPYSIPKCNFLFIHWRKLIIFSCVAIWMHMPCWLDLVQSPPYGCHSLNSYNICLCWTTEFIQHINNKTMATFHSATRLSAQWNVVLKLSKHSSRPEWTELVIKPTAELHTLCTCGLKPNCVLV